MNIAELKDSFFALVPSHPPNDWEIEEHLENIAELPAAFQKLVLSHVPAIWAVSHSLCYSYLSSARSALDCLPTDRMTQWVGNFLDTYEKDGLRAAQHFMADVESNFLCRIRGEAGLAEIVEKRGLELAPLGDRTRLAGAETGVDDDPRIAGPEPGFSQLPRDFTAFVESMYLEAMLYMGAIADPRTGETIEDVELAKYKIDLLIMLQEKTEGNLTTEEKQQFDDALYQLRMLYLQKTKTASL